MFSKSAFGETKAEGFRLIFVRKKILYNEKMIKTYLQSYLGMTVSWTLCLTAFHHISV